MTVSRTLRRYRGWIAAGILIVIAVVAYQAFQRAGVTEPTTTYTTEAVSSGTISVTVAGTGNLEVDDTTEVWPATAGTVASVKIAEGDAVSTGTVLFTLDAGDAAANTARALASYRQAQQGVTSAESQLLRAENNLANLEERYEEQESEDSDDSAESTAPATASTQSPADEVTLGDIDVAEKEIDVAQAGLTSASSSCASALLAYQNAQETESDLTVTSPVAGVIFSLDIEAGDAVSPSSGGTAATAGATAGTTSSGAPITIVPEQSLAVHLIVNEVDLPALEVGQRADIEFDAFSDLIATGKIYDISEEGRNDQGVVTFDVWLALDVIDDALKAGMSAAATIVTEIASDTIVVPNAAVKSDGDGGSYVLVLNANMTEPRQTSIEVGLVSATQTEVLSGLEEGDKVVTQSVESSGDDEEASAPAIRMPGMGGGR